MTTCEDTTFERLLAHLEDCDGDPALSRHVAGCARCATRAAALRMQSLALTMLARRHRGLATVVSRSDRSHPGGFQPGFEDGSEEAVDDMSRSWVARGPGACLGAARDAGLTRFHLALRELFLACLTGASRPNDNDPSDVDQLVAELTVLSRRLSGLGLTLDATGLPTCAPTGHELKAVATPILDRIVALEGDSSWVARARNDLALADLTE
jgi:hypothetical protein